jgi:hypothetical protein
MVENTFRAEPDEVVSTVKPALTVSRGRRQQFLFSENAWPGMRVTHGMKRYMRCAHNPNAGTLHYHSTRDAQV